MSVRAAGGVLSAARSAVGTPRTIARETRRAWGTTRLVLTRIPLLLEEVERILRATTETVAGAQLVVAKADAVADDAAQTVAAAQAQVDRSAHLVDGVEPLVATSRPTLMRAAVVLAPDHVDAVARLLELTPDLLDLLDPALRGMGQLSPELKQLAERFDSVGQIVQGLPGASTLKRRGAEAKEGNT